MYAYIVEGDVFCECDLMTKGVELRITERDVADSLSIGDGNIGVRASGLIIERSKTDSHIVCDISDLVYCVSVLVYVCVQMLSMRA